MSIKDIKKLYILIAVLIILMTTSFLWFAFNSNRKILFSPQENQKQNNEDLSKGEIKDEYEEDLKKLADDYFKMREKGELDARSVIGLQEQMMQMTLNEEQKDLHLTLFLLLEDMKKAFAEKSDKDIAFIQERFEQKIDEFK